MSAVDQASQASAAGAVERRLARISNLSHVQLRTPKLEESTRFFTDVLGMVVSERDEEFVYLRCFGDYMHHALVLRADPTPGLDHVAYRLEAPEDLSDFAARLREAGHEVTEVPAGTERGQGDAIRFEDLDGHPFELFHDFERAAPQHRSLLRNQPEAFPYKGVGARRIDHINLFTPDVGAERAFLESQLGFKLREGVQMGDGAEIGAWMSVTVNVHDIALTLDRSENPKRGRLHHVAFYVDSREQMLQGADLMSELGVNIEAGPAKHGITQAFFMYVIEPGGNRIELFSGGYQIFEPDWQPVIWGEEDFERAIIWWGARLPQSYLEYGT